MQHLVQHHNPGALCQPADPMDQAVRWLVWDHNSSLTRNANLPVSAPNCARRAIVDASRASTSTSPARNPPPIPLYALRVPGNAVRIAGSRLRGPATSLRGHKKFDGIPKKFVC